MKAHFHTEEAFQQAVQLHLAFSYEQFTKGERIALDQLIHSSSKNHGVSDARICKMVQATHDRKGGISRSTFERMLRKALKLAIIEIQHTIRKEGGNGHSIYRFQPFDRHKMLE
jgi:hypothetical protein